MLKLFKVWVSGKLQDRTVDRAWLEIKLTIESQNFVDYPWIYTAHTLTQTNEVMLADWRMLIRLHCQLVKLRCLTADELERITYYWLGSKGIERFI